MRRKFSWLAILLFFLPLLSTDTPTDDRVFFTMHAKPTLLFILDNSGSMTSQDVYVSDWNSFKTYTTSDGITFDFMYSQNSDQCDNWGNYVCRETAARRAFIELSDQFRNELNIGLMDFYKSAGSGGKVEYPVSDISDTQYCSGGNCTQMRHQLWDTVYNMRFNTWTPLAETLDTAYWYFKNQEGGLSFPSDRCVHDTSKCVHSPIKYWCQKNFVILLTDGSPTADAFNCYSGLGSDGLYYPKIPPLQGNNCPGGPNDYDIDGDGRSSDKKSDCYGYGCYSDLLDDVSYYVHQTDLRPDMDGEQNLTVYTVALRGGNSSLLQRAANNGGGLYFNAQNYDELVDSLRQAIQSILEKALSFAPISPPKRISSTERYGFISWFLPKAGKKLWEGHQEAYELNDQGEFYVDNDGNPTHKIWDAGQVWTDYVKSFNLSSNGKRKKILRNFYTFLYAKTYNLGDIKSDVPWRYLKKFYNIPSPYRSKKRNVDSINASILGCRLETSGDYLNVQCNTSDPHFWAHGDVFHSNVVMVGKPFAFLKYLPNYGEKYAEFYDQWKDRPSLIYYGTNDGTLRAVTVQTENIEGKNYEAGMTVRAFVPTNTLPTLTRTAINNAWDYFVDGSITAVDVRVNDTSMAFEDRPFFTLLTFGLRQGGKRYYGIDVTDPAKGYSEDDNGNGFGRVLWEFPAAPEVSGINCSDFWNSAGGPSPGQSGPPYFQEICIPSHDDHWKGEYWLQFMGQTWGKPRVGLVPLGSDKIYAVVVTGGYPSDYEASDWGSIDQGAGLFILDASSGEVIKAFVRSQPAVRVGQHGNQYVYIHPPADQYEVVPELNSLVGTPTAVDLNSDGLIDTIYVGDTKGNIWKVDLSSFDKDEWHMGKLAQLGDDQPILQKVVVANDSCGRRWVFAGTGRRDEPLNTDATWHMVGIIDTNGIPSSPITMGELQDITSIVTDVSDVFDENNNPPQVTLSTSAAGWKIKFQDFGEKLFDDPIAFGDLYFTTYTPTLSSLNDPCSSGGLMRTYRVTIPGCGGDISSTRQEGRLGGGGVSSLGGYEIYITGSSPGSKKIVGQKQLALPTTFGPIYWRLKHEE